jgi:hypothetical protein
MSQGVSGSTLAAELLVRIELKLLLPQITTKQLQQVNAPVPTKISRRPLTCGAVSSLAL